MAQQTINLNPGESRVVSFEATPTVAKTYQVEVDGLAGSFVATPIEAVLRALQLNGGQGQTINLFRALGAQEVYGLNYNDYKLYGSSKVMSMAMGYLARPRTKYYMHNGHGDAEKFYWGEYEQVVGAGFVQAAMMMRPPITFASLESCDSMKLAQRPTSFAYYLTKGFSARSGVVGSANYLVLSSDYCGYYGQTRDWFYDYLLRGYPVYKAYRLAVNKCIEAYGWDPSFAFKYLGDQSPDFRLKPQQEFPEEELP